MLDDKTFDEIRQLDKLLKRFCTLSQNDFVLFPFEDNYGEMPGNKYFEIIQQVFNNPAPPEAVCN